MYQRETPGAVYRTKTLRSQTSYFFKKVPETTRIQISVTIVNNFGQFLDLEKLH